MTLFFCDERDYLAVFAEEGRGAPFPYGNLWTGRNSPFLVMAPDHPPVEPLWRDLWELHPPDERRRLLGPCATFAEARRLSIDVMGGHELGHLALQSRGLTLYRWAHWLEELLSTYLMRCALRQTDESLWTFVETWLDALARIGEVRPLAHTSLDDFEARYTGVGMENYTSYLGQIGRLSARIFADLGESFVDRIAAAFGRVPPGELAVQDRVGQSGLVVKRVAEIWPPIAAWTESMARVRDGV